MSSASKVAHRFQAQLLHGNLGSSHIPLHITQIRNLFFGGGISILEFLNYSTNFASFVMVFFSLYNKIIVVVICEKNM